MNSLQMVQKIFLAFMLTDLAQAHDKKLENILAYF